MKFSPANDYFAARFFLFRFGVAIGMPIGFRHWPKGFSVEIARYFQPEGIVADAREIKALLQDFGAKIVREYPRQR